MLVLLIVAIATPATMTLSYYQITGDPTFRPLAITLERLVVGGIEVHQKAVRADIVSDGSPASVDEATRLGDGVRAAFRAKGTEAVIRFEIRPYSGPPTVTFFVRDASFGPYSKGTAAQGVRAAITTLQLSRSDPAAARRHRW
ncbi:hypothetical protein SAMN04488094_10941 [Tropicimonas isoalkanivorans]|uniref:Uncharacterized protein n=1 Tax=Tropicimonas isoalkanivorans TaxID=441112 RepID=A0A1I1LW92_9RHOB|nr:hypothetical protein SAMN04488094_10941 [Tropicimonas isoalkanivorans]